MKTLNIIGCGKLGKALARLWSTRSVFRVAGIVNRTLASAQTSAEFIGQGTALNSIADLGPADVWMISADDSLLRSCAQSVHESEKMRDGDLIIHCSGALPSSLLLPPASEGDKKAKNVIRTRVGSIHPVRSFADPSLAVTSFHGTHCAVEGMGDVVAELTEMCDSIGGKPFVINADQKLAYHAAFVFVSNYLVTLVDVGQKLHASAQISQKESLAMVRPIIQGTLENIFKLGVPGSLTGPIARGNPDLVRDQCEAIAQVDPLLGEAYRVLGLCTNELAARKEGDPEHRAELIRLALSGRFRAN